MNDKTYSGWEKIGPLGEGGQSDVFLVRSPKRAKDRADCLSRMLAAIGDHSMDAFAEASLTYARPDEDSELGALKVFKIRNAGSPQGDEIRKQEIKRFHNELRALTQISSGLPKLQADSHQDLWIITEYFRNGSLDKQITTKYKGNPVLALKAFRSLVATVKLLHAEGMVHRDIKPANVFVRKDDELVLGDFGIIFVPQVADRVTQTMERVGPRDYMAPWLDIGERVEDVKPCADVYMLGKLLWCMVSGRLKLPREYHRRTGFDLETMFPNVPHMDRINVILDKCLVSEAHVCLHSASELLTIVEETITDMSQGENRILANGDLSLRCLMCGKGTYKLRTQADGGHLQLTQLNAKGEVMSGILVRAFACNICLHYAYFAPGYPEEGAQRGWKPT